MIGAVNCVRRAADGSLTGHNTDVVGLRASLDELLGGEQPEHALVLGTGGASQAVQYVLAERGIPFDLVSRDTAKGNYTYDDLPCEVVERSRLIVNASPVGTYPAVDAAPRIPYGFVTPGHYLLDLVYNPPLTQFLDYGRQRGRIFSTAKRCCANRPRPRGGFGTNDLEKQQQYEANGYLFVGAGRVVRRRGSGDRAAPLSGVGCEAFLWRVLSARPRRSSMRRRFPPPSFRRRSSLALRSMRREM